MDSEQIIGLCVEDEPDLLEDYQTLMSEAGFDKVIPASNSYQAMEIINTSPHLDLLWVDLSIPQEYSRSRYGGYEVISAWHEKFCHGKGCGSDKPVLIITRYGIELSKVLEEVKHYPHYFFIKGKDEERLTEYLTNFVANKQHELDELRSGLSRSNLNEVTSEIYKGVKAFIAQSKMPVLITGDTGVGKEHLAREIHEKSGRKGPFRVINCAAFTENLIFSELFGYVKGAFTDAKEHSLGIFFEAAGARSSTTPIPEEEILSLLDQPPSIEKTEMKELLQELNLKLSKLIANENSLAYKAFLTKHGFKFRREQDTWVLYGQDGGTLFLDEIADLPASAQAGLLRVLEGRGIRPVGYTGMPIKPDVRIIAATNNIKKFDRGDFRHDLFWRLAGWVIELPNLKERVDYARSHIVNRAANATVQGQSFDVDEQALDHLVERVRNDHFSRRGDLLKSGNFRNLNWLIDRACAIARSNHQDSPKLLLEDVLSAEKWVIKIDDSVNEQQADPAPTSTDLQGPFSDDKGLREDPIKWIEKAALTTYEYLKDSDVVSRIKIDSQKYKELSRFLKEQKNGDVKIDFTIISEYYRVRHCSMREIPTWVDVLIFIHFWQRQKPSVPKLLKTILVNLCNSEGGELDSRSVNTYKYNSVIRAHQEKSSIDAFFDNALLSKRIFDEIVDKETKKNKT